MKVPLISIIVPTFNRSEMLRKAVNSMLQQETDGKFSYEIIIIDDASTDGTREVIGEIIKHSPELVKYVKGEGKGYTFALNKGLAESHGEWVALFDDDELANPDWLKELYAYAMHIGAQCVGGRRELALPEEILAELGPVCRGLLGEALPKGEERECSYRYHPGGGGICLLSERFSTTSVNLMRRC